MVKNEICTGEVEDVGYNGEGILKTDGYTVFVPFTLVGERVKFKVLKVKDKIVYGKLIEVINPSISRLKPICPVFTKCGGCQLQHAQYGVQLKLKSDIVRGCLSKIAFIDIEVPLTKASGLTFGYRNKLQLPVREENGEIKIGFFANGSHRVIDIDACPIHPDWCKDAIASIRRFMKENRISAYNEATGKGLIKHVVVRSVSDKYVITVVVNGKNLPKSDRLIEILKEKFSVFSLNVNVNEKNDNVIFGEKFINVYGESRFTAIESGVEYEIGPQSFMQVNDSMREELYRTALKVAQVDLSTVVIDAYSGAGLLTALFAEDSKKAIGIEIVKEAVDCADSLKERNKIDNMKNVCAPCEDVLPSILEEERKNGAKCVVALDPPRKGVDKKVIEAIQKCRPDRIVYISCSPQSLARDVGLLTGTLKYSDKGIVKSDISEKSTYRLAYIQPFDLFPQTKHVETVCLLTKK